VQWFVRCESLHGVARGARMRPIARPSSHGRRGLVARDLEWIGTSNPTGLTRVSIAGSASRAAQPSEPSWLRLTRCLVIGALAACAPAGAACRSDRATATTQTSRIHLSVRPATAEANAVTAFRFVAARRVGDSLRPVRAARVSFAGAHARTDRRGVVVIVRRLRTGRYRARACKPSLACGMARVVVLPHGSAP
jgi:hypothetical protein